VRATLTDQPAAVVEMMMSGVRRTDAIAAA